jgi:hypothetical protein
VDGSGNPPLDDNVQITTQTMVDIIEEVFFIILRFGELLDYFYLLKIIYLL